MTAVEPAGVLIPTWGAVGIEPAGVEMGPDAWR